MLILHGSDLQVGKPFRPDVAEAFLTLARELEPQLVVVSGDLTQRAKRGEYRRVRAFLDALGPVPVVVTPGNHDVPLYRAWERLLVPYAKWKRYVAPELDTVTGVPGATVVALNSSAPRRAIVGGYVSGAQLDFARAAFLTAPSADFRVLVVHHHFVPTPDRLGGSPLPGAESLLHAFEEMRVDVVLGGHVHQTHLTTSRDRVPGTGPGIPLVACGTTASARGRGPEAGRNSLNVVRLGPHEIEVTPHFHSAERGAFLAESPRTFPRPSTGRSPAGKGGVAP